MGLSSLIKLAFGFFKQPCGVIPGAKTIGKRELISVHSREDECDHRDDICTVKDEQSHHPDPEAGW
jgi:hypothetical protein